MNQVTNFKISIGAIVGTLLLGGGSYTLVSLHKERPIIPFFQEKIENYAVNIDKLTIESVEQGENIVITTKDKKYLPKDKIKESNCIELEAHSPLKSTTENNKTILTRNNYQCSFEYESLTEEEKQEKINLFINGDLNEVFEGYTWAEESVETPVVLTEEMLSQENYAADMTIYDVNYDDSITKLQTSEEDFKESLLISLFASLGCGFGWFIDNDVYSLIQPINEEDTTSKKKLKKKRK